jgi:nucleotide-binding universal stress UspA family protein
MFKRILVPTDGSDLAGRSVAGAIELARTHGASLVALHVFEPLPGAHHSAAAPFLKQLEPGYEKGQREESAAILDAVAKAATAAGVAVSTVIIESDDISGQIVAVANQEGCDLICMASHGHGGIAAVVLGSETQKVLVHTRLPVLVFR